MTFHFINDPKYRWDVLERDRSILWSKGCSIWARKVVDVVEDCRPEQLVEQLKSLFENQDRFSCGVIETESLVVAWVDHIRSWPLFYSFQENVFSLSNDARSLKDICGCEQVDPVSCLEFALSGYVAGKRTLFQELNCLQPGEFLIFLKNRKELSVTRFFHYQPVPQMKAKPDENSKHLGDILDQIIVDLIERVNGRPLWIPLSGGLDSRVILCKLHEHGYKNIQTFTYGPKYNFEARYAKKVAKALNVPWMFISPSRKELRASFTSDDRRHYWAFSDGLKAIPSMREFATLLWLVEHKLIPSDAIFVNGQSGDYITGGHVSKSWFSKDGHRFDDLFEIILSKHYDLWKGLKIPTHIELLKERTEQWLCRDVQFSFETGERMAGLEESWEYEARQICLVVNGQQSYDYFGFDWELPLWEKRLVDFCQGLSFEEKLGQNLYKNYLKNYNYKGLFPHKEPDIWRWPLPMMWVVPLAQLVGLLGGKKNKQNFYALLRYHGHYSNQFYSFPWQTHKKTFLKARNVMSLNVREWALENRHFFPEVLLKGLLLKDVD